MSGIKHLLWTIYLTITLKMHITLPVLNCSFLYAAHQDTYNEKEQAA